MTGTNSNTERLYSLLSDLSPELLADAFPEGTGTAAALPFSTKRQHIRRIGRAIAIYAACIVVLVGAVIYLPKLLGNLSPTLSRIFSESAEYYSLDGEWKFDQLTKVEEPTDMHTCISGSADSPILVLKENRTLNLTLTAIHQSISQKLPFTHTLASKNPVRMEVLMDGLWYAIPTSGEYTVHGNTVFSQNNDQMQIEYTISEKVFGYLPEGNYRIAVSFDVSHSYAYGNDEEYTGAVYIPFTVVSSKDYSIFTPDGKLNLKALVVATQLKTPQCLSVGENSNQQTNTICLSESRFLFASINMSHSLNRPDLSSSFQFNEKEHYYLVYPQAEIEYLHNGIWYKLPFTATEPVKEAFNWTEIRELMIPEEYAARLPAGEYRTVFRVHAIHRQSTLGNHADEDYIGGVYLNFTVVEEEQNPIYHVYSLEYVENPWYDYEARAKDDHPLGKLYCSELLPNDTSNPNARYVMELAYVDSQYTLRPLDDYIEAIGYTPMKYPDHPNLLRKWYALTKSEIEALDPQKVQAFYGLEEPPAILATHAPMPIFGTNTPQATRYRVDLPWLGESIGGSMVAPIHYDYNGIKYEEPLHPEGMIHQVGYDAPCAIYASIYVEGKDVSAKDFFASHNFEIMPDVYSARAITSSSALLAVSRNQLYSLSLSDVAEFYGCNPEDVEVFIYPAARAMGY